MSTELLEQVLALPYEERLALASRLLESVTEEQLTEAARNDEALLAEIRRRDEEMTNGVDPCQPFDEAMAEIERSLRCD